MLMKIIIVILVISTVSIECRRNRDRENQGRINRKVKSLKLTFPECEDFARELRRTKKEMRRNDEISLRDCRGGNFQECLMNEMMNIRCKTIVQPSTECIQRVTEYFTNPCPGGDATESDVGITEGEVEE